MFAIPSMLVALIFGTVLADAPPASAPAAGSAGAPKMVRYTDKPNGFSLEHPEHWEKAPNPNEHVVAMFRDAPSGPDDKVRENINVVVTHLPTDARNVTLDQVLPAVKATIKQQFPDVDIIEDAPTKLAGQDAHKIVYRAKMQGVDLKFVQVMAIANSNFYTVTFTSTTDGFPKYEAVLAAMLESFRLEH